VTVISSRISASDALREVAGPRAGGGKLLEIEGLTKTYRRGVRANDGVTLSVEVGSVYGLLGHNGAGKTTLVNQIVGLLRPDAGAIRISGHDVVADPGYARRACSVQPQAQVPINGLTPAQAIGLVGRLRGGSSTEVRARTAELVEALDIGEWLHTDGARLSGGVKRLVSFCMAAVAPGALVILDEPTNDVDPVRRRLLWAGVRALADCGSAVLLVTHNVVEAERSVDRLTILDHGRVVAAGTPAELKAAISDDLRLEFVLEPDTDPPQVAPFVRRSVRSGNRVVVTVAAASAADAAAWGQQLRREGQIEEFSLAPATLEDAYVGIVDRTNGQAQAVEIQHSGWGASDARPA
jgi:ABC-2 type transport system ATP-binding protein